MFLAIYNSTSRFKRNQVEFNRHEEELRSLGKVGAFVSKGIINGNDRDFLSGRINETVDEQYSRCLPTTISD